MWAAVGKNILRFPSILEDTCFCSSEPPAKPQLMRGKRDAVAGPRPS